MVTNEELNNQVADLEEDVDQIIEEYKILKEKQVLTNRTIDILATTIKVLLFLLVIGFYMFIFTVAYLLK